VTSHRNPIPNKGEEEETQRNEESTKRDLKTERFFNKTMIFTTKTKE